MLNCCCICALMSVKLWSSAAITSEDCGSTRLLYFLYTSFRLVQPVNNDCKLKCHLRWLTVFRKQIRERSVLNDLELPSSVSATLRVQPPAHDHCPITKCNAKPARYSADMHNFVATLQIIIFPSWYRRDVRHSAVGPRRFEGTCCLHL